VANDSSLVIDSLSDHARRKTTPVAGLYCDFLPQQEQSTVSMLGAILRQLVSRGEIPEHIWGNLERAKEPFGIRSPLLPDMVENLNKTIASLQRAYVCIDAVDELAPKHRRDLLGSLQAIVRASPKMRILITGRPRIDDEILEFFIKAVWIPISPSQDDIKSYLEMRLKGDTTPKAMDGQLRADITRVIPEKASEM